MLLQTVLGSLLSTNRYWIHKHTQSVGFQGGDLQIIIQYLFSFSIATFSSYPLFFPFFDKHTHSCILFLSLFSPSFSHTHTHTSSSSSCNSYTATCFTENTHHVSNDIEKYQHLSLTDFICIFLWEKKPQIRKNLRSSDMQLRKSPSDSWELVTLIFENWLLDLLHPKGPGYNPIQCNTWL